MPRRWRTSSARASAPCSSQGDIAHCTAVFRGLTGVNGTGVKIGVLSDGVANLAAAQASGDLGAVTVLPGQAGTRSRRHGHARDHSRPRAGRAAVLRHGVQRRSPSSPRTSATCAPPAATSSSTTSSTSSSRRFRTARRRGHLADQRRHRHPGRQGRGRRRRAVFLVGRQFRQSERRHVRRLGRRLRGRRRGRRAAAPAGPVHQLPGAQNFNTLTAAGSGPINLVLVGSARRVGATTTTCSVSTAPGPCSPRSTNLQNGTAGSRTSRSLGSRRHPPRHREVASARRPIPAPEYQPRPAVDRDGRPDARPCGHDRSATVRRRRDPPASSFPVPSARRTSSRRSAPTARGGFLLPANGTAITPGNVLVDGRRRCCRSPTSRPPTAWPSAAPAGSPRRSSAPPPPRPTRRPSRR